MNSQPKTLCKLLAKRRNQARRINHVDKSAKPLDLLLAFDTTPSIYSNLQIVRKKLSYLTSQILQEAENTAFGVFAFSDCGCTGTNYVTRNLNLTGNVSAVQEFINHVDSSSGAGLAAIEDTLFLANQCSWRIGAHRAIVLVGDAQPRSDANHCPNGYSHIREAQNLAQKNVRVYTIQCGSCRSTKKAFQEISKLTNGKWLSLENSDDLVDLLTAISLHETGSLDKFKRKLVAEKRLTDSKLRLLETLSHES